MPTPVEQHAPSPQHLTRLGLQLLRLISHCPRRTHLSIAHVMGALLHRLSPRRRAITRINLQHCFPELSATALEHWVRKVFTDNAMGLIETMLSATIAPSALDQQVHFEGLDALRAAHQQGQGLVLVGAHYSTLDLGGLLFSRFLPVDIIYRPHNNPCFNDFLFRARERWAQHIIPRHNIRAMYRSLKAGRILWYPADQDYGRKHTVFAPFFNVPAATITMTAKLARLVPSPTFVLGHHRLENGHYRLSATPIPHFPQPDEIDNATVINATLEQHIRFAPTQYMWVHRRFKTRPEHETQDFYAH